MRSPTFTRKYLIIALLCLLIFGTTIAPAMATMPARFDMFPQSTYCGMQLQQLDYEGVSIVHTIEPQEAPMTRYIDGQMEGDTIKVRSDIRFASSGTCEWSAILRQGNTTTHEEGVITGNATSGGWGSFNVSMPIDPSGPETEAIVTVSTGAGDSVNAITIVGTFYNQSHTWPTSTPQPTGLYSWPWCCCGAALLPLLAVGLAGTRVCRTPAASPRKKTRRERTATCR